MNKWRGFTQRRVDGLHWTAAVVMETVSEVSEV